MYEKYLAGALREVRSLFSCEKQLYDYMRLCPSVTRSSKTANSSKFNKIQQYSRLFAKVGRMTALHFGVLNFKPFTAQNVLSNVLSQMFF